MLKPINQISWQQAEGTKSQLRSLNWWPATHYATVPITDGHPHSWFNPKQACFFCLPLPSLKSCLVGTPASCTALIQQDEIPTEPAVSRTGPLMLTDSPTHHCHVLRDKRIKCFIHPHQCQSNQTSTENWAQDANAVQGNALAGDSIRIKAIKMTMKGTASLQIHAKTRSM